MLFPTDLSFEIGQQVHEQNLISERKLKIEQGVCRHNQTGFCKFKGACQKYHENEMCRDPRCSLKECRKRHPRLCKYFRDRGTCIFGEGCSYIHKDDTSKKEINEIKEELNNINAEIMIIKDTVKSLSSIKKRSKSYDTSDKWYERRYYEH